MRKLLLASAATVGLMALSYPAGAVEVVLNGQINKAEQSATFELEHATGTAVNSTVAAIGNTFTFNGVATTGNVKLDSLQVNLNEQKAINDVSHVTTLTGVDGPISLSSVAVGNTLSGSTTLDPAVTIPPVGGSIAQLNIKQINAAEDGGQTAIVKLDDSRMGGVGTSAFAATAVGNAVGLTIGAITNTGGEESTIKQINKVEDFAGGQIAVVHLNDSSILGDASASATAVGNALSITTTGTGAPHTGDLNLDKVVQINKPEGFAAGQLAVTSLHDVAFQDEVQFGNVLPVATANLQLSTVAVGNTASFTAANQLALGKVVQVNDPEGLIAGQGAFTKLQDVEGLNNLGTATNPVTTVAIGNSLSGTASGPLWVGDVIQKNFAPQFAKLTLENVNLSGSAFLTTAAIGNSISLTGGPGPSSMTANLFQLNPVSQTATADISHSSFGNLTSTVAAIGNSASVTIK